MKNVITYLKTLWRRGLGSQSSEVGLDCRLTVGSPSVKCGSTLMRLVAISAFLLTVGVGGVWGQVTLTYEWTVSAGKSSLPSGVTHSGLGSDYAAANAPYYLKYDGEGDHIQIYTDDAASEVKFTVKMLGGNSTSKFKVQGCATSNGDFSDIQEFTCSGAQNDVKTFTTSNSITSTYRYFRITKSQHGSNVGLGYVKITKAIAPATVSFSTGAGNPPVSARTEASAGAGITLPSTSDLTPTCSGDGWELYGWTTAAYGSSSTTTAPTSTLVGLAGGSYSPSGNITLYAVYRKAEVAASATTTTYTINGNWTSASGNWTKVAGSNLSQLANGKWGINSGSSTAVSPISWTDIETITFTGTKSSAGAGSVEFLYGSGDSWTSLTSKSFSTSLTWSPSPKVTGQLKCVFTRTNGNIYIASIAVKGKLASYTYWSAPTCCTPLGSINGSFSFTSVGTTGATANWGWTGATTGISKNILKVYKESDNSLVATIDNISASATSQAITSLDPCTEYYVKLSTVSSGGGYCDGVADQTGASHVTFTTSSYTVTKTGVTNVTAASLSAIPATTCSGFGPINITAADGYVLPAEITVSGASHTWNQATGALTISSVTGNVSITITPAEESCPDQYTFDNGGLKQCFTQVGKTNEFQITDFTIPTTTTNYWVGYNGAFYNDNLGTGSPKAKSANNLFKYMPVANLQGSSCGGEGESYKHAAAGAYGTLRIFQNSSADNLYVGFVPAGYQMRMGSGASWTNIQLTQDGSVWTSDLMTLDAATIAKNYYINVWTGASYSSSDEGVAINNWTDGGSTISSMAFKTGAGDNWDTSTGLSAGMRGKFRTWTDNCANNGYCHFVPYYQLQYNPASTSGTGTGSMSPLPASPVSCEESAANRTVTVATSSFTAPQYKQFDHWNTAADNSGSNVSTGSYTLTSDVTLYAQWADIPVTALTLNHNSLKKFVGESTVTLSVTGVTPAAANPAVNWSSSDATVASVTDGGVVSFLKAGTATITATSTISGGVTATCSVEVRSISSPTMQDEDGTTISGSGLSATWTLNTRTLAASEGTSKYKFKRWIVTNATPASTTNLSTTLGDPTGNVTVVAEFYKPRTVTKGTGTGTSTFTVSPTGEVKHGSSVTVTCAATDGYKNPWTLTVTPSDGATYSSSGSDGSITISNITKNITVDLAYTDKGCTTHGASSITSGASTGYTQGPVDEFYKYSTRQIIYTKSDLGLAAGKKGTIKSISFQYGYGTAMTKKTDVDIYLANTNLTSLTTGSYVPYANFTKVYSGALNCSGNGTWNEFEFTTSFEYNGVGQLVVMIDDNSGDYDGMSYVFQCHSGVSGAQVYKRQDSDGDIDPETWTPANETDSRPNTKFCIEEDDMTPATVNWYVNGSIEHTQTDYPGTALTSIPTPDSEDCDGEKEFVGWYTDDYTHASIAPAFVNPTVIPEGGADYYAVFATASGSGSGSVVLSYTSLSLTTGYESGSTKSVSDIDFYCNDIMTGTSGSEGYQKIQFKKSSTGPGYIYNSEAMPGNITSIVLSSTTRDMTVNFGTSSNPDGSTETTTCTSSSLTATPSGSYKYFKIIDAVDNASYIGTITINYSSVSYSDYETNCCTPLGAVASVTLTKTAYTITATWPTTSGGTETGYSVQLYDNSGGSKGDAIGDPVEIDGTDEGDRTCTFGAKTPAGSRLTANHKYYVGVTPTYSGAGDYCPTGTETVANTTTNQTYTVTYNANGGTVTTLPSGGTYEEDDEVTVANKPGTTTKSGCTFTGWNTANDGTGEHYDADGSTTFDMPVENVVLYAEWTTKKNYFIDRMHGNWDGEHTEPTTGYNCYVREGAGYTVPDLSDDATGSNSCVSGHEHFIGWVIAGKIGAQGQLLSGYTVIKGGTVQTAGTDGTIYYAVWAEE